MTPAIRVKKNHYTSGIFFPPFFIKAVKYKLPQEPKASDH